MPIPTVSPDIQIPLACLAAEIEALLRDMATRLPERYPLLPESVHGRRATAEDAALANGGAVDAEDMFFVVEGTVRTGKMGHLLGQLNDLIRVVGSQEIKDGYLVTLHAPWFLVHGKYYEERASLPQVFVLILR